MFRWRRDGCSHLSLHNHSEVRAGVRLWTCSLCGRTDRWGASWSYWGNIECKNCWLARIDYVFCSPACRDELVEALGLVE